MIEKLPAPFLIKEWAKRTALKMEGKHTVEDLNKVLVWGMSHGNKEKIFSKAEDYPNREFKKQILNHLHAIKNLQKRADKLEWMVLKIKSHPFRNGLWGGK